LGRVSEEQVILVMQQFHLSSRCSTSNAADMMTHPDFGTDQTGFLTGNPGSSFAKWAAIPDESVALMACSDTQLGL
jgi:hypothetical protein